MEEESGSCSKEDVFFDFVPTSFTSSTPSTNSKDKSDCHIDDSLKMSECDIKAKNQSSSSTDEPESNDGVGNEFRSQLKYNISLDDLNFGVNQSFKSDNSSAEINRNDSPMTHTNANYSEYFSVATGLDTEGNSEVFGSAFTEKLSFVQPEKQGFFQDASEEYSCKNQSLTEKFANANKAASTVASEVENSDGANNLLYNLLNVPHQEISNDKCISDIFEENMHLDFETEKEVSKIKPMQLDDSFIPDYEIMTEQDEEREGIVETNEVSNIKAIQPDDGCILDNDMADQYKETGEGILETNEVLKMKPMQLYDCCIPDNDILTDKDRKTDEEMETDREVPKIKSVQLYDVCVTDNKIFTDQDKLETDEVKVEANEKASIGKLYKKDSTKYKSTKTSLESESTEENLMETITDFSQQHESEGMVEMDKPEEIVDTSNSVFCIHCKKHLLELGEGKEKKTELEMEIDVANHSKDEEPSEYLQIDKIKPYKGVTSLLDLFEVDNLLSKRIVLAMSSKYLKSGATQTEIVQYLKEENCAETLAKLKFDVTMFLNAAMNAGIIYTKNRRNFLSFVSFTENSSDNQKNNATKRKFCGALQGNAENMQDCRAKRTKASDDAQSKSHAGNQSAGTSCVQTKGSDNKDMKKGVSKEVLLQKKKVSVKTENLNEKKSTLRSNDTEIQNKKQKEKITLKRKVTAMNKSRIQKENGSAKSLEDCRAKRTKVSEDAESKSHAGNKSTGTTYAKTMPRGSDKKNMKKNISKEVLLQKKKVNVKTENLHNKKCMVRSNYTAAQNSSLKRKVITMDKSNIRKENGKNKKETKGDQLVALKNDVKRDTAKTAASKDCKKQKIICEEHANH